MGDLLLRILERHPERFVSGEEIGRQIGISRAAEAAERGAPHGMILCPNAQTGWREVPLMFVNRKGVSFYREP